MSLLDASDEARAQGFEVALGAALADYPAGSYGHYQGEYVALGELGLEGVDPSEASADIDTLIHVWSDVEGEIHATLKEKLAGNPNLWFTADEEIWMTEAGAAALLPFAAELEALDAGTYRYDRLTDGDLFAAIDSLVYSRIAAMESAWGEVDPEQYELDEETEAQLEGVEDEQVRDALTIVSSGDPDSFVVGGAPTALARAEGCVHTVCEIEDAGQQDYVNAVLFIPRGAFGTI
jgi:malonyl CoA-acyl carrier protein transacylase